MTVFQFFREMVPLGLAVPLSVGGLTATVATHAAVLAGRLSHTAVSGGRVTDPVEGRRVAALSVCGLLPVTVLVARGAGIDGEVSPAERGLLGVLAMAGLASVPLRAVGTTFERRYMAPAAAAFAVGVGRLAVER